MNTGLLDYSAMASQYGPFFFALLFIVVAVWASRKYTASAEQPKVQRTYGRVFVTAFAFSCACTVIAIFYYIGHPPIEVFQGTITNLQGYETVTSGDLYFRRQYKEKLGDDPQQYHDDHFIVYQTTPFTRNQPFDLLYWKQGSDKVVPLQIAYTGAQNPRFKIEFNPQTGKTEIKTVQTSRLELVTSAYAAVQGAQSAQRPVAQIPIGAQNGSGNYGKPVDVLQEETTAVGLKIFALDSMIHNPNGSKALDIKTSKEPFTVTLADLSRHSDKELAYKAQMLMDAGKFDETLAKDLGSRDQSERQAAEETLFHLDKNRALNILERVPTTAEHRSQLEKEIRQGSRTRLPVPTGSPQGDLYFVQARWDKESSVKCVYNLFTNEVFSFPRKQNQAQQSTPPPNSAGMITNFYDSKTKAIAAYDQIEKCGAKAKFVPGF